MLIEAVTVGLVLLYIFLIVIPSLILNSLVIVAYIRTKTLHTPPNLLAVHLCIIGLILTLFYSPVTVAAFIQVMTSCQCTVLHYHWVIGHIFHFSLYPHNILLLTISYFVILKFSSSAMTFRVVIVALVMLWIFTIAGNLPIVFLTREDTFIECCEAVCMNETSVCNQTLFQEFTPHTFTTPSRVYYNIRDWVFIIIPTLLVFLTSGMAYCVFKRSALIRSKPDLKLRMFFLPILMTFSVGFFILGQDVVNWQPSQVDEPSLPGVFVFVLMGLIWDSNGVYFALLILYFNVNIRRSVLALVRLIIITSKNTQSKKKYTASKKV